MDKEKNLDPSSAMLLSEKDDVFNIWRGDKEIEVSKKGLSENTHNILRSLPRAVGIEMASSGAIEQPTSDAPMEAPKDPSAVSAEAPVADPEAPPAPMFNEDSAAVKSIDETLRKYGAKYPQHVAKLKEDRDKLTDPSNPANFPGRVPQILRLLPSADAAGKEKLQKELSEFGYVFPADKKVPEIPPPASEAPVGDQISKAYGPEQGPAAPFAPEKTTQQIASPAPAQPLREPGTPFTQAEKELAAYHNNILDWNRKFEQRTQNRKQLETDYRNGRIDPEKIWETGAFGSGSGGKALNQMLAGFSILLGGIGQGLTKSATNPALEVINRAMDQNIALQKANFEKMGKQLSDWDEEENRLRTAMLTGIKTKVELAGAKTSDVNAKLNAAKTSVEIEKLMQERDATAAANAVYKDQPGGITAATAPSAVKWRGQIVGPHMGGKEQAQKLNDELIEHEANMSDFDQLKGMFEKTPAGGIKDYSVFKTAASYIPGTDTKEQHDAAKVIIERIARRIKKQGAVKGGVTEEGLKMFTKAVGGDPTSLNSREAFKVLSNASAAEQAEVDRKLRSGIHGYKPIKESPAKTK
jgi:hypothetical protein